MLFLRSTENVVLCIRSSTRFFLSLLYLLSNRQMCLFFFSLFFLAHIPMDNIPCKIIRRSGKYKTKDSISKAQFECALNVAILQMNFKSIAGDHYGFNKLLFFFLLFVKKNHLFKWSNFIFGFLFDWVECMKVVANRYQMSKKRHEKRWIEWNIKYVIIM